MAVCVRERVKTAGVGLVRSQPELLKNNASLQEVNKQVYKCLMGAFMETRQLGN